MKPALLLLAITSLAPVGPTSAADNLLSNEGFESPSIGASTESSTAPSDWTMFSNLKGGEKLGLSAAFERSGKQSLRITSPGITGAYQGVYQSLSVSPGTTYVFSVYVRNDKANPIKGPVRAQLAIEWRDDRDVEIAHSNGPDWSVSLFSAHWVRFDMTAKAPANASRARFVVVEADGKEAGGSGSFLIDDASVTQSR